VPLIFIPALIPFCCFGFGCCVSAHHGGVSDPGCPAVSCFRLNGCRCCRNGVHRHTKDCSCGPLFALNCSFCSTCCHCCRRKFFDRRRWTWVAAGWINLPSDWGEYEHLPSIQHYGSWWEWRDEEWIKSGGGIFIPPKQTAAVYIHCAHPDTKNCNQALAVRGPFKRGYQRGDITDKDAFIRLRTGCHTMHPLPFANADLKDSSRDGQFYQMHQQHLDEFQMFAFAGKVHYRVLDPKSNTLDCAWCCGSSWCAPCRGFSGVS
jgi:hypothetical protein